MLHFKHLIDCHTSQVGMLSAKHDVVIATRFVTGDEIQQAFRRIFDKFLCLLEVGFAEVSGFFPSVPTGVAHFLAPLFERTLVLETKDLGKRIVDIAFGRIRILSRVLSRIVRVLNKHHEKLGEQILWKTKLVITKA